VGVGFDENQALENRTRTRNPQKGRGAKQALSIWYIVEFNESLEGTLSHHALQR
jgi:hypothetical protein